ncbi:MAG: hypothetical protein ACI4QV_03080, partial [Acutalibacteraceae bacterium]
MSIYSTRLPGVYMTVNSRLASPKDKKVCIAAASESGTAGECVTLFSPEAAETSFGTASDS